MANTHSLDLEASSSQYAYIASGDQTNLNITNNLTVEMWVKVESQPAADYYLASKFLNSPSSSRSWAWIYDDNGAGGYRFRFFSADAGGSLGDYSLNHTLTVGSWTHIATTFASGTAEFFVNGSSIGSGTGTLDSSLQSEAIAIALGADGNGGNNFDGKVDEFRIWNDVRSEAEILANYKKEISGASANLQCYLQLNNDYTDQTSNSNDFTGSGSPTFSTDVPFPISGGSPIFMSSGGLSIG